MTVSLAVTDSVGAGALLGLFAIVAFGAVVPVVPTGLPVRAS